MLETETGAGRSTGFKVLEEAGVPITSSKPVLTSLVQKVLAGPATVTNVRSIYKVQQSNDQNWHDSGCTQCSPFPRSQLNRAT
jgi:hypothetical protein